MTPLTINLKPEVLKALKRRADIMGISVEEMVERMLSVDVPPKVLDYLSANQVEVPAEIQRIIDENFWELIA